MEKDLMGYYSSARLSQTAWMFFFFFFFLISKTLLPNYPKKKKDFITKRQK